MPEAVLVVEEDPDVRALMVALVENEGHRAVPAASGGEALRLLRDGLTPCLILLDAAMPATHGRALHAAQGDDPRLAAVPTIVVAANPIDLDAVAKLLKTHCINNHRFA